MKRRWQIAGLAGLAALATALFLPLDLAERTIERYLLSRLSQRLGVTVQSSSGGAFAVLPMPRFVANDVRIVSNDGTAKAMIPRLRADIRILALLGGRIEFSAITLQAPQVEFDLPPDGFDLLSTVTSQVASLLPSTPQISVRNNGAVFFRNGPGIVSSLRDVNIDMSSRKRGDAIEVAGTAVWRGEKLEFAIASNSAARATMPMARIRSDLANIDFTARKGGTTAVDESHTLEGPLSVSAPSMSRLGSWLAAGSPVLLPLGNTAVTGRLRLTRDSAQVRNSSVTLGNDTLEGGFDWRKRDARWALTGTFAGKSLDIGRPDSGIDTKRLGISSDNAGSVALDIDDLLAHDIDLRLSLQPDPLQ